MSRSTFILRLTVAERSRSTAAAAAPPSSRVQELLDEQHPRKMIDNMALIIIDQTYSALLEILGPDAPPPSGDVHVSRPVDPADPESPLLSVTASARHCCISLYGGAATVEPDYTKDSTTTSSSSSTSKQSSSCQFRLARTTITASPSTLHLARVDGGGAGRGDYWACADARPDVAGKGLLAVVETVKARLDAAIRLEATLLGMAKKSRCSCRRSPKMKEVVEARAALEKMAAAVDLDAIMRRRSLIQEEEKIACRADVDQAAYDVDVLATRLSALHVHVGQKRGCPVEQEMSCRKTEVDDAEVLCKRLKALHV